MSARDPHDLEMMLGRLEEAVEGGATVLDLRGLRLDDVPEVVQKAHYLQTLDLRGVGLRSLPDWIGSFKELRWLRLDNNALVELPDTINWLNSLEWLELSSNYVAELPEEISQLRRLRALNVANNALRLLPEDIHRLQNLRQLNASNNALQDIPAQLGRLSQLEHLDLSGNGLEQLPIELTGLRSLRDFDVSRNRLRSLPSGLGGLTHLEVVRATSNRLTALPASLATLRALTGLHVADNPLVEPLATMAATGLSSVQTYLKSLLEDGIPQHEVKVVFVGEGAVGKSSIVARLQGQDFIPDRPTTHGIDRSHLVVEAVPGVDHSLSLNLWDFGGQDVYRVAHQAFFSQRALYLVVWNSRDGAVRGNVETWLRRILLRVGREARVLLVATHCLERRADIDLGGLDERFPGLIVGVCEVDSSDGSGIAELVARIAGEAAKLPHVGELVSARWADARSRVESLKEPQIDWERFCDLLEECGLGHDEWQPFAEFLVSLGQILFYGDDEGLSGTVVLQPDWLSRAVSFILEDRETLAAGGVLEHSRLSDLWGKAGYAIHDFPFLVRLMERFDVSYRLPGEEKSLIGQLVPSRRPAVNPRTAGGGTRALRLICSMDEEPAGLMEWLIVRNHCYSTGEHWRRGVVSALPEYDSVGLFELERPRELELTVWGPSPSYLFNLLRGSLELVLQRWPGLDFDLYVPCRAPRRGEGRCEGRFRLKALEADRTGRRRSARCEFCYQERSVDELLTGFPSGEGLSEWRRTQNTLDALANQIVGMRHMLDRDHVSRDEARQEAARQNAETANLVRGVLRALSEEVDDCPKMMTVEQLPPDPLGWKDLSHAKFQLQLWCEHPGCEHPVSGARYEFFRPRRWFLEVAPYLKLATSVLRTAPLAKSVVAVVAAGSDPGPQRVGLEQLEAEIGLIDETAKLIREAEQEDAGTAIADEASRVRLGGAGLRILRQLLISLDGARYFGGLRRTPLTAAGDRYWVCREHYPSYALPLPSAAVWEGGADEV